MEEQYLPTVPLLVHRMEMTAAQRIGSPRDLFMSFHWKRLPVEKSEKTAIDKLMISEVMSFVGSIHVKMTQQKKSFLRNAQENYVFQSISGSQAIHWNFHRVTCLDELVVQDDGTKSGGREAEFQEWIQLNLQFLVSAFPKKILGIGKSFTKYGKNILVLRTNLRFAPPLMG